MTDVSFITYIMCCSVSDKNRSDIWVGVKIYFIILESTYSWQLGRFRRVRRLSSGNRGAIYIWTAALHLWEKRELHLIEYFYKKPLCISVLT